MGNAAYLIDTNVLVYSLNISIPQNTTSQRILTKIQQGEIDAVLTNQNLLETFRVLTSGAYKNPHTSKNALTACNGFKTIAHLIMPTSHTLEKTFELVKKYNLSSSKIFDTYLVATMLENDVDKILTFNKKDFALYSELSEVIVPS